MSADTMAERIVKWMSENPGDPLDCLADGVTIETSPAGPCVLRTRWGTTETWEPEKILISLGFNASHVNLNESDGTLTVGAELAA